MSLNLTELYGVDPGTAEKLRDAGLSNSDAFLEAVAQPDKRKALSDKLGIPERALLELGNRADLARIKGVGSVYSDLLEYAGVDTVAELAKRVPANLLAKLEEVASHHQVVRLPKVNDVEDWVNQAKKLDRKLSY